MVVESKNYIVFLFLVSLIITCSKTRDELSDSQIHKLKLNSLKGDSISYERLSSFYFSNNYLELLSYSMIMAKKYDYSRAYYDTFEVLILLDGCVMDYNLGCLDKKDKELVLTYFVKAIEKGDFTASKILLDYYDEGKSYPIKELYTNKKLIEKAKLNLKKSE